MKERDTRIDILKFIGIMCIILAHTTPPDLIFELRNFDVVLMVMLTGVTYCLSNSANTTFTKYLSKRFCRLVIPTWIFLTILFFTFFIISWATHIPYPFNMEKIIRSYFLIDGIGYVWIMRIYFLTALLLPLLSWASQKIKRNITYFLGLIPVYFAYNGLIEFGKLIDNKLVSDLYQCFIVEVLGWGIIVAIGVRVNKLCIKELLLYICLFFTAYLSLKSAYDFAPVQHFKYPPQLYYISYGLCVSFLLMALLKNKFLHKLLTNKMFIYIAHNSLWLYLWHIIPVYIIKYFGEAMHLINYNFLTRFIFIFSISLLLTSIQNYIFNIQKLREK